MHDRPVITNLELLLTIPRENQKRKRAQIFGLVFGKSLEYLRISSINKARVYIDSLKTGYENAEN
jgi:hypothetical protein